MKKKGMAVGALLMAVAITGYSVSGTYAKYVSSVDLTDEARVAKWAFNVNGSDAIQQDIDLFKDSYTKDGNKYVQSLGCDVDGNNCDKVVAPGTAGQYKFDLSGNMEVRYTLDFDVKAKNDFVVYYKVENNTVKDMKTRSEVIDELTAAGTLAADATEEQIETALKASAYTEYRPIKYTISYNRTNNANDNVVMVDHKDINGLIADLNTYKNNNISATNPTGHSFAPGAMNQHYTIDWEWKPINKINGLSDDEVNKLDTFAGKNLSDAADKVTFGVKITATQVADEWAE